MFYLGFECCCTMHRYIWGNVCSDVQAFSYSSQLHANQLLCTNNQDILMPGMVKQHSPPCQGPSHALYHVCCPPLTHPSFTGFQPWWRGRQAWFWQTSPGTLWFNVFFPLSSLKTSFFVPFFFFPRVLSSVAYVP